ncbi:IS30 family transposase, partial [Enterococcus faecium]
VSNQRNHIPRKSLNYRTPIEIFLSYVQEAFYSSLICQIIMIKKLV